MLTREELEMQCELELDLAKSLLLSAQIGSEEFAERKTRIEDSHRRLIAAGEARPRLKMLRWGAGLLVLALGCFAAVVDADEQVAGLLGILALAGLGGATARIVEQDRNALGLLVGPRIGSLALHDPEFAWAPIERENSMVCLRIKNYPNLLEISGGVLFSRTMGELLELIEVHARTHDGILEVGFNGQLRVIFGTPASEERRLERAARFALDLRRTLATRDHRPTDGLRRLRLGIGIHQGRVVSGLVGAGRRRAFMVCGKALELADELADAAAGGEIFVSDPVHRDLDGILPLRSREPMFSTSMNQVVRIYSLEAATPRPG